MKNKIKIFIFLFLFIPFLTANLFSQTNPPTGLNARYYCRNEVATQLTANTVSGGSLRWYGTSQTGGTSSLVAPIPSTTTDGLTYYYVTQVVSGVESSPRSRIEVNVNKQFDLFCDGTKLTANSVNFDFNNVGQSSFNFTYTVKNGTTIVNSNSGTWNSPSNFPISGLLPGQTVDFTITAIGAPSCVNPATLSDFCVTPCPLPKPISDFDTTPQKYCDGASISPFSLSSPNGITGKWNPPTISNTIIGETIYTFTPDNLCAIGQNISVTIIPNEAPTFTGIDAIKSELCENEVYNLPTISTNNINGTWSPSTLVDTSVVGITPFYTFTPNVGECFNATVTFPPISIDVKPSLVTSYVPLADFCAGTIPAPSFPTITSVPTTISGITGNWVPNTISTVAGFNQEYQFTPTTKCATTPSKMVVNVKQSPEPTFLPIVPDQVCEGSIFALPNFSNDTPPITGSWSTLTVNPIATIDTSTLGTEFYTFTPDGLQCAKAPDPIAITVNPSDTLINVDHTVTNAFEGNQIITVVATAPGNYLYQLDSGPLQTSPIFENVSAGIHQITVSDANGCSAAITESNILVIKHPKYFTPNGDGFNDTWKLSGLTTSLITKIYIFDRYGKLFKEISADGAGWDGTYLGVPMPADDYWFTVDYLENLTPKKFKSHFSLKR